MGRKKGFSLLEVMVAMDVMAVALFFIIGIVPFDNASVKQDAHIMIGTQLAQGMLRSIEATFWNDGTSGNGVPLTGGPWDGGAGTPTVPTHTGTVFPPSPYPGELISTTSDGVPDSRHYYFNIDTEAMDNYGNIFFGNPNNPNADPSLRYVQVVVYWHEQGAIVPGPNQPGYRNITVSGTIALEGGQQ